MTPPHMICTGSKTQNSIWFQNLNIKIYRKFRTQIRAFKEGSDVFKHYWFIAEYPCCNITFLSSDNNFKWFQINNFLNL